MSSSHGDQFCANCGRPAVGPFCAGCGQPLAGDGSSGRGAVPYLLVLGGALLAAGMVVAAILLTRGDAESTRTPTATEAASATPLPPAPAHKRRKQRSKPAAPAPAPSPDPPTLTPYSATYYSLDRPAEWTTEHDDEEQAGGLLRSQAMARSG